MASTKKISLKRKFIKAGVFEAEVDEFLKRELAEDGYSGVCVRETKKSTEVLIQATKTMNILGHESQRIREINSLLEKRYGFPEDTLKLYADKIAYRGLSAVAQTESLRACYGVLRFIIESGARGAEVVVSGKIKGQRAKAMKFTDGHMIHSGDPVNYYVDRAVRHVQLPQGIIGIKIKIMKNQDPTKKMGPAQALPDHVPILAPKEDIIPENPYSEKAV